MNRVIPLALFIFCVCLTPLFSQDVLCVQEHVKVFYYLTKTDEGANDDGWEIRLDIQNTSLVDVFYTAPLTESPLLVDGLMKPSLFPPYLIVKVTNALGASAAKPIHVHGIPTLHATSGDSTSLFKVDHRRNEKKISARIRKGEEPMVTGVFLETLRPLDQFPKLKMFKKN